MLGLVDYGSSGDESDGDVPQAAPASKPIMSLPLPSSSLKLPPPSSTAAAAPVTSSLASALSGLPAKKAKGPVRIMLDLPKASSSTPVSTDEPPRKRPKFALGGSGSGVGGLASMLPAPKNETPAAKLEKSIAASRALVETSAGEKEEPKLAAFVPYSLSKGKKAAVKTVEPEEDFFGISSTVVPEPTAYVAPKSSMSISSAPSIAAPPPPPSASTSRIPTADDPYPGFTQLPSGQWVAKDQETYDLWMASMAAEAAAAQEVPRGFGESEVGKGGGLIDVVGGGADWNKPKIIKPGREEEEKKAVVVPANPAKGRAAKSRGQLSSLLSDAMANREALEERIAAGKANRRTAGNRYGF